MINIETGDIQWTHTLSFSYPPTQAIMIIESYEDFERDYVFMAGYVGNTKFLRLTIENEEVIVSELFEDTSNN